MKKLEPAHVHWIDEIIPDPEMQVSKWDVLMKEAQIGQKQTAVRRAFVNWVVTNYEVRTREDLIAAVGKRFGLAPSVTSITRDLQELGVVKVPTVGSSNSRYRLLSSLHDIGVEDELNERIRIDVLRVSRHSETVFLETNRGVATAVAQLVKLAIDDGVMRDIHAITTDGDCYVVVHAANVRAGETWERWLQQRAQ